MEINFKPKTGAMEKYFDDRMESLKEMAKSEGDFSITDAIVNLFDNKYASVGFFDAVTDLDKDKGAIMLAVMVWLSQEVEKRMNAKDKTIESLQYALDELMRNGVVNGSQS